MKFVVFFACASVLAAQTPPQSQLPQPPRVQQMSEQEEADLRQVLGEAGNSAVDFERALENHLAKYPKTTRRAEFERALVKTAIDLKDNARIIRYGESVLSREPDDLQILEQVAVAELQTGGDENVKRALQHAEHFEQIVAKSSSIENQNLSPRDLARRRDEHDRAFARAYVLEARAHGLLGETDQAVALAEKSYQKFASVEAAREAARWLDKAGKTQQAIDYLADAFSISGLGSANTDAANDRKSMGDLYRKLNGSEKGLGDVILKAYDHTASQLAARREQMHELDPNANVKDPMQFTLSEVQGGKLPLASLKGKVIVMDFWATWCGPCRAQHPLYEEVKKRFKDRDDVVFLAVDSDEDHSVVKPFLEQNHWNQKVYFEDGLATLLNVANIPTTLIFDKHGEIFSRMAGYIPDRFVDMLTDRIKEALGQNPAVLQATKQ